MQDLKYYLNQTGEGYSKKIRNLRTLNLKGYSYEIRTIK